MKLLLLCGSRLLEGGLFGLMLLQNARKHGRTIGAGGGGGESTQVWARRCAFQQVTLTQATEVVAERW